MSKRIYEAFVATEVPLKGSNLIEASAGTGKTYSIAILALRLLVVEKISLEKILMVTFTKAAVAELQERVRLFVRLAEKVARGEEIADVTITSLVQDAIERQGREAIADRLKDAVLLLDELSIMTIHGFCQQSLTEFAFETGQLFGAEMFTETNELIEDQLNVFWRRHVTTLLPEILKHLDYEHLRNELLKLLRQHLGGMSFAGYDQETHYDLSSINPEKIRQMEEEHAVLIHEAETVQLRAFQENFTEIAELCTKSRARNKKEFVERLPYAGEFLQFLHDFLDEDKKGNALTQRLPESFMEAVYEVRTIAGRNLVAEMIKNHLFYFALQEIEYGVRSYLLSNNLLTYNDLIRNLHRALTEKDNQPLVRAMTEKYKAVFVDEFQDTDREQYEIFIKAFPAPTLFFFIGDPKQSIYSFRKADIFTYFMARAAVDHCYSMNINYRSSAPVIAAMNHFFKPEPDFDTFSFAGSPESIEYFEVESPAQNAKGELKFQNTTTIPLSIYTAGSKEQISKAVALQIQTLLTEPGYEIVKGDRRRPIRPSDIGILIRNNYEATGIKNYLSAAGIPAVLIDDGKIFQSKEAESIFLILQAIWEPVLSNIYRALLSGFCKYDSSNILTLDSEDLFAHFQSYKEIWLKDGVYPALVRFVRDFNVREHLLRQSAQYGERALANLYQLIELINKEQQFRDLSPEDLISWLRRGVNGMEAQGDEFQVRMESDEDAVKIVTIHKSKGLEYNIVFAPFLDLITELRDFNSYRDPNTGAYIANEKNQMTDQDQEWFTSQQEQENRRLIYVALTRAVYKCYIYRNTYYKFSSSSLAAFMQALQMADTPSQLLETGEVPELKPETYRNRQMVQSRGDLEIPDVRMEDENWRKLSYSAINMHADLLPKERSAEFAEPYDDFIFNKLRFGAATGNLLHELLENIDFEKSDRWQEVINRLLKAYLPASNESFSQHIFHLLRHVVSSTIRIDDSSFSLQDVAFYKRIAELEFDFPIQNMNIAALAELKAEGLDIIVRSFDGKAVQGMMNGKIDLFFEHEGKYYILDWKSNYLGHTTEHYSYDGLLQSMNENNYHLQYLIYTLAVKKYLSGRLGEFDYEKHFGGVIYVFLRGVRKGSAAGIFTARPAFCLVEKLEQIIA